MSVTILMTLQPLVYIYHTNTRLKVSFHLVRPLSCETLVFSVNFWSKKFQTLTVIYDGRVVCVLSFHYSSSGQCSSYICETNTTTENKKS